MVTSSTLRTLVRSTHPDGVLEPLDAHAPTDLPLRGPTVIIEVVGAREALDALARVRRVAADAPVAAVRIATATSDATDPGMSRTPWPRRVRTWWSWRSGVLAVLVGAVVVGTVVAARRGSAVVSTVAAVAAGSLALLAVIAATTAWVRARRQPVERRRHFERRRSLAVIAVAPPDDLSAAQLATSVRRELQHARPGEHCYDVTVFEPPV